jgi:hypothetical protein
MNEYAIRGGVDGAGADRGIDWMTELVFPTPKAAESFQPSISGKVDACPALTRGDALKEVYGPTTHMDIDGWHTVTFEQSADLTAKGFADRSLDNAISISFLVKQNVLLVVPSHSKDSVASYAASAANVGLSK